MPDLAPVAPRLARLLLMLTSEHDGEIVAAVHALRRTLKGENLDMHALAEVIETSNGVKRFSEADAREIYERGIRKGRDEAEAERGFRSVGEDDQPSWHEIACECAAHQDRLRDEREREFVADMERWTVRRGEPSEKQAKWLRAIYARVRR